MPPIPRVVVQCVATAVASADCVSFVVTAARGLHPEGYSSSISSNAYSNAQCNYSLLVFARRRSQGSTHSAPPGPLFTGWSTRGGTFGGRGPGFVGVRVHPSSTESRGLASHLLRRVAVAVERHTPRTLTFWVPVHPMSGRYPTGGVDNICNPDPSCHTV